MTLQSVRLLKKLITKIGFLDQTNLNKRTKMICLVGMKNPYKLSCFE